MAKSGKRQINRLSAVFVSKTTKPGYSPDGAGLYLRVLPSGAKSWAFIYTRNGKTREMSLGSFPDVSLEVARNQAFEARKALRDGVDPIDQREASKAVMALVEARKITFAECCAQYIASHRAGWKSAKHADQWTNTLATYCGPVFGHLPVADVDLTLVMKVLDPIWRTKPETASRLRGRIEAVIGWAKTRGYRTGDNPALWSENLENLLPQRSKIASVRHHPALPYAEIGSFMAKLRKQDGIAARSLEVTILTALRTSEVINADWSEIDLDSGVWTIPPARMKMKKEHRVPLSSRVREILMMTPKENRTGYIFPGLKEGRALSNMAMLALLERMGRGDLTVHGFRSTFRDWAAERTNFSHEVCEMALAHAVGNQVEAAYRRGDLFIKRSKLMQAWASFCESEMFKTDDGRVTVMVFKRESAA